MAKLKAGYEAHARLGLGCDVRVKLCAGRFAGLGLGSVLAKDEILEKIRGVQR